MRLTYTFVPAFLQTVFFATVKVAKSYADESLPVGRQGLRRNPARLNTVRTGMIPDDLVPVSKFASIPW